MSLKATKTTSLLQIIAATSLIIIPILTKVGWIEIIVGSIPVVLAAAFIRFRGISSIKGIAGLVMPAAFGIGGGLKQS